MEILPTIDALHWCADAGPEILADEPVPFPQLFLKTKRSFFSYEPIGVVGVIAPWNYPWSIPFGEVAIALMAGNGVVFKPASLTPLLGERIQRIFEKGGLARGPRAHRPRRRRDRPGALRVPDVGKIFFTGLGRGRPQGRRDLRGAAEGLGPGARRQGPADRLRRRRSRERRLGLRVGRLRERRPDLLGDRAHLRRRVGRRPVPRGRRAGDGAADGRRPADVGDRDRPDGLRGPGRPRHRARRRRARGRRRARSPAAPARSPASPGRFIAPTVLAGVEDDMRIMREEIFGPVVPIIVVARRGGGARARQRLELRARRSVWTTRPRQGRADGPPRSSPDGLDQRPLLLARRAAVPRGAGSRSPASAARTRSSASTSASNVKHVAWEPGLTRDFWWQPYDRTLGDALRSSARLALRPERRPGQGAS